MSDFMLAAGLGPNGTINVMPAGEAGARATWVPFRGAYFTPEGYLITTDNGTPVVLNPNGVAFAVDGSMCTCTSGGVFAESANMLLDSVGRVQVFEGVDTVPNYTGVPLSPTGALCVTNRGGNPANLFAAGEVGAWYDPSDLTTLFQDSAGTTPVTAVEQPVGLMLDKSKGLVLGSELVTNGAFDTNLTGWTLGTDPAQVIATWTASGVSITRGTGGIAGFSQDLGLVIGKTYRVSFELISGNVSCGGGFSGFSSVSTLGVNTRLIIANGSNIQFWATNNSSTAVIDNISVRELPGNHASQATTTSRPVLSARVNLLTYSEQFDNAVWNNRWGGGATITANDPTYVAPDGTITVDKTVSTVGYSGVGQAVTLTAGVTYTLSAWIVSINRPASLFFSTLGNGSGTTLGATSIPAGTSLARYSVSVTPSSTGTYYVGAQGEPSQTFYIWGADLRVANDGVGIPAYQRVNTATDYDTAGFPLYLRADGVDDWLQTGNINFSATDKMTVWAGVRKLSDAATAALVELSSNASSNVGSFAIYPSLPTNGYTFRSAGTTYVDAQTGATFTSPITNVLAGIGDIAGDNATLRINAAQAATNSTDQGTGNYGTYPLYIFRRGGVSLPFNGRLYSLIVRGAASTASQIAATETWVNTKTRAY